MSNSRAIDVANAAVALLNSGPAQTAFGALTFAAVRDYVPLYGLTQHKAGLLVTVIPQAVDTHFWNRPQVQDLVTIDVGIQNYVKTLADKDALLYRLASSLKCGDPGWPLSPPAVTALACTVLPNSTTATKLFPLVPYHFLVPGYARAPKEASEPHCAEGKPTGMLGPASLNGWTRSPVRRWNRLMSPHGVFQLPKSAWSLSDAAASDWSSC